MSEQADIKYEFGKALGVAHLESAFDKYLVIGFSVEKGSSYLTNCDKEQLELMLAMFFEEVVPK